MKKFNVSVTVTYDGSVEVDASSKDEAMDKAWRMVKRKEIDPIQEFDPYTEIAYAEEIPNDSDFVTCPHCEHVVSYSGLIGETTDDCPRCGKTILEKVKDEQI